MLDIRTLYFLNFLINAISTVTMATIWLQYRKRYKGLMFWLLSMLSLVGGFGLFLLRERIPDFFSILVGNFLILTGSLFLLIGLEKFFGIRGKHAHNYLFLLIFSVIDYHFYANQPDINVREMVISSFIALINIQTCWLLFRRVPSYLRRISTVAGIILSGFVIFSIARFFLILVTFEERSNFFAFTPVNSLTMIIYFSLFVFLLVALVLMVNTRLLLEVRTQEEKFYKAFHSVPSAIVLSRPDTGEIIEVNDSFEQMSGYRIAQVLGKTTVDLKLWDQEEDRLKLFKKVAAGEAQGLEIQLRNRAGKLLTGLFSADMIDINGEEIILSSFSDITEISEIKQQLHELATHDPLTKLPNRSLFYDRFEIALASAQRKQRRLAVMSLDLDNLKTINDQYGHLVGDSVLIETGNLLVASLRKSDTVARFGGDEFLILVCDIHQRDDALKIAQKVIESCRNPLTINGSDVSVTASLGVAMYPDDGSDLHTLIKKSDQALYYVKENGRDGYHLG